MLFCCLNNANTSNCPSVKCRKCRRVTGAVMCRNSRVKRVKFNQHSSFTQAALIGFPGNAPGQESSATGAKRGTGKGGLGG